MIKEYEEAKQAMTHLHEQVKQTQAQLSTDGKQFTAALSEEITSLKLQINISRAKRLTEDALKVCLLAQEASLALLDRRFEESLAKLDQVQAALYTIEALPEIVAKLSAWVEEQLGIIREQAVNGFKDWLAQLRQQSDAIGKILMGQTRTKLDALSKLPRDTPLLDHPELCISLMSIQLGTHPKIIFVLRRTSRDPSSRLATNRTFVRFDGKGGRVFKDLHGQPEAAVERHC